MQINGRTNEPIDSDSKDGGQSSPRAIEWYIITLTLIEIKRVINYLSPTSNLAENEND